MARASSAVMTIGATIPMAPQSRTCLMYSWRWAGIRRTPPRPPPGPGGDPMPRRDDAPRDLLFGLLALQNGMVTRDQLVAAFGAWTASDRPMADLLVEQGALSPPRRALLDALAA